MTIKQKAEDRKVLTADNHYEKSDILGVGMFMEMFNQLLYEALCEQGGCDGTDTITKQLSVDFSRNESDKVMEFLQLNNFICDCDAYCYMTQYIRTLYPPPRSLILHVTDPFCDDVKKRWSHLFQSAVEALPTKKMWESSS